MEPTLLHRISRPAALAVVAALVLASPGCSVRRMAVHRLADALAEGGTVYASDDDPELVRDALPFALKTMETLALEAPDHRGLRLALCRGFTQYAYAFVEVEADRVEVESYRRARQLRDRALRLYLRARDYGLAGLELDHPGLAQRLRTGPVEAAAETRAADLELVFWTGMAWGAVIGVGVDRPELAADVDAARALLRRALELDPDYDRGAVHQAMVAVESLPEAMGGSPDRAERHFRRAVELSGGNQASPFVLYAESVAVARQDRAAFVENLERALAVDPDAEPAYRLANLVSQRKARALLDRVDEFFLESD